jgi:hypothetical protein
MVGRSRVACSNVVVYVLFICLGLGPIIDPSYS